ncbi:MAG: hypothetical protein Q9191_006696 [Dirinaria sp. TL-2023a]
MGSLSSGRGVPASSEPKLRPTETLEQRVSDMSIASVWTDEDEQELADIKGKLHQAHKKWSAEQELWHDRHEELEDLKRAWLKWEKKRAKAARKDAEKGQERNEVSSLLVVGYSYLGIGVTGFADLGA